jgi:hypothetical protein
LHKILLKCDPRDEGRRRFEQHVHW